jgi:soluble lytic murein transglycosylase
MYYSVIYDWRLHGSAAALSTRMTPLVQPYSRPNQDDPRKALACPAPSVAAASSTAAPAPSATLSRDGARAGVGAH